MTTGGTRRRAIVIVAGIGCIVIGLLMLAGAGYLRSQRAASAESAKELRQQLRQVSLRVADRKTTTTAGSLDVPLAYAHLADVETMVRISEQQGVRLGALQFRSDGTNQSPYVVRVAEFRLEEDYTRLKAFLAELLVRMPHMYLDELRVDRSGDTGNKVQATLRMSFVYHGGMDAAAGGAKVP